MSTTILAFEQTQCAKVSSDDFSGRADDKFS